MQRYLLGLKLAWWNKGIDDLLSLIFVCPLVLPISISMSIIQTTTFTYKFLLKKDIHKYYYDCIDRSGVYKCHLHNKVFGLKGGCPGNS